MCTTIKKCLTLEDVVEVMLEVVDPLQIIDVSLVVTKAILSDEDVPIPILFPDPVQERPEGREQI